MSNTLNDPNSPNSVDPSWANIGKDTPFNEDLARARIQAAKSPDYYEEDPETQTIFFSTPEVANANETLRAQNEKEMRLRKQSAKIVESFMTGKHVSEIDEPAADDNGYITFYGQLNHHQLTPTDESAFLQSLATPLHHKDGFSKTYAELNSDHEFKILAFASGKGFGKDIPTAINDLQTILETYPTPVEFQVVEDRLLDGIRRVSQNSPGKVAEYQKDFETFKQKIYGKRQEYHEAWQKLERDARNYQILHAPRTETPEEYAEKVREGVYAEYFYPSEDLGYLAPEAQAQYHNPDYQPVSEASPSTTPTPQADSKKGLFGKLFGRKK